MNSAYANRASQRRRVSRKIAPTRSIGLPGFTLIELMIVTAIIGILAGVAFPRTVESTHRHRAISAAHRVAADLRYARRQAMLRSAPITVAFYPASEHYQIDALNDIDQASRSFVTWLARHYPGIDLRSVSFAGSAVVTFDHYGLPSSPGTIRLVAGTATADVNLSTYGEVEVAH